MGVGREANVVICLFTSERAWKGNFVIDFVHVGLVGFQILGSLKVSTFHKPCLLAPVIVSSVCDDIMVLFRGL